MPYLSEFFTVAAIHLFAVMTPGPDFLLVSRNSLVLSKKTAVLSALGLALGILVHVLYSLLGIGLLISQSLVLFSILKYLGAGYLFYIGIRALTVKPLATDIQLESRKQDLSSLGAIRVGFLTNLLNPKVTLFFFALFTQVIHASTPTIIKIIYGLEISFMTFLWFFIVATILSHSSIKSRFSRIQYHTEKVFGGLLIALGIKLVITNKQ